MKKVLKMIRLSIFQFRVSSLKYGNQILLNFQILQQLLVLFIYLFIYLSFYLFICLFIYLFIYLFYSSNFNRLMFCRIFGVKLCYQIKKQSGYSHLIFNKIVQRQKVDEIFGTSKKFLMMPTYIYYMLATKYAFLMTDFSDVFARQ